MRPVTTCTGNVVMNEPRNCSYKSPLLGVYAMDRVLHSRLWALQDSNSSRGAGGPSQNPSSIRLPRTLAKTSLPRSASHPRSIHHESLRQTFPPENLGGSQMTKASTQAEIIQQGLGSGAESSKKNVIPPRPFCQDRGNGSECAIEVEWHPRSLIHRTGALPGSTEV